MKFCDNVKLCYDTSVENDCIRMFEDKFFGIKDNENNKCSIVFEDEKLMHFKVLNEGKKQIGFIAIDKCVFSDSDPIKRCDFILYGEDVVLFVEIKESSRISSRNTARKEAFEQLKSTIQVFATDGVFSDVNQALEAIICIPSKKSIPATTSSKINKSKELLDSCKAILKEGSFYKF